MAEKITKVVEIEFDADGKKIKEVSKEIKEVAKNTDKAKKSSGGLASGFKKISLAAAGIGAALAILTKLADLLGKNQKVLDIVDVAMTSFSIVIQDLFNFIVNNYETVSNAFSSVFEDPMGSLEELGTAIQEGLIKRFNQFVETLGIVRKAIKQLFEGDFSAAWETAKEAAVESVDIITGEDGGLAKIIEIAKKATEAIVDYTSETLESASALTENAKAAEFLEIKNRELQLSYQKLAEEQRQIRDDEAVSIEERIIANEKLGEILKKAVEAEQAAVQKRIDFLEFENKILGSNQERELELANLRVEKLDIEERIQGVQSEQLVNTNSLLREQIELKKSIVNTDQQIMDIESATLLALEDDEMKKLDIIKSSSLKKYEAQKAALDAEIALHKEGTASFQDATNQRNILEAQRTAEVKIQAAEVAKIEEEAAAKKKADQKAAADATVALANATMDSLSALNQAFSKDDEKGRREAFKREKALGIASAVINTAKSAVSAYNSMAGIPIVGPVLGPIAAAAAIAAGAAQIKNITKQKYKGESGGGGGGGASGLTASGGGSAPSAPQFNTVGTSGFNQINESLNNNNRNPVKAYVVSGEVSSAQSLDRNRIKEATFP